MCLTTSPKAAYNYARKVGQTLNVTISIGGALARPEDDIPSLLHRADQNMYQSKLNGRNRVICEEAVEIE